MARKLGYYSKKIVDDATGMNDIEKRYSEYLDHLVSVGDVHSWKFESLKFILADKTTYTPDFMLLMTNGTIELHETKGRLTHEANVKIKITAKHHPEFIFRMIFDAKITPEQKLRVAYMNKTIAKELGVTIGKIPKDKRVYTRELTGWDITVYPPHKKGE